LVHQADDLVDISAARKQNLKTKKLNDQVLRVMQSLGIDPVRTAEVRFSAAYFYFLNQKF
jgi:hypothetical protein